jgi:hypothetical protein
VGGLGDSRNTQTSIPMALHSKPARDVVIARAKRKAQEFNCTRVHQYSHYAPSGTIGFGREYGIQLAHFFHEGDKIFYVVSMIS